MKKITTLFKKDQNNLGRVINEVDPENEWAFIDGMPTRKFDGTGCAVIGGELYKRFGFKEGRTLPANAIPCQDPDEITGHHPHWIKCDREDKSNKYHFEAFDKLLLDGLCDDGTYELLGEKVQGNPEGIKGHELFKHGRFGLALEDDSFQYIKQYLTNNDIEGIVFHHKEDGRMCKIRKSDFGIKRIK